MSIKFINENILNNFLTCNFRIYEMKIRKIVYFSDSKEKLWRFFMNILPGKKILSEATITVLKESKEMLSVTEINMKVATLLNIPKDLLDREDTNCTGTEFNYKMRWVRTDLKQKGIALNPKRGFWIINS